VRTHYVSPRLVRRIRPEKGGFGVFARQKIVAGDLLVVWGVSIVPTELWSTLSPVKRRHSIQVEENLYLVPHEMPEVGDFVNHSCSPNAGLSGQTALVARCTIQPGEEICYDYAMSDGSAYDEFACGCGSVLCRGRVTGHDWRLPELQERYAGAFSPYLQRRIDEAKRSDGSLALAALGSG
jgi:SET domain-containing protein